MGCALHYYNSVHVAHLLSTTVFITDTIIPQSKYGCQQRSDGRFQVWCSWMTNCLRLGCEGGDYEDHCFMVCGAM